MLEAIWRASHKQSSLRVSLPGLYYEHVLIRVLHGEITMTALPPSYLKFSEKRMFLG